jgi:hypothetical protein
LIFIGGDFLLPFLVPRLPRALLSRLGSHRRMKPWPPAELVQLQETSLRGVGLSPTVLLPRFDRGGG